MKEKEKWANDFNIPKGLVLDHHVWALAWLAGFEKCRALALELSQFQFKKQPELQKCLKELGEGETPV